MGKTVRKIGNAALGGVTGFLTGGPVGAAVGAAGALLGGNGGQKSEASNQLAQNESGTSQTVRAGSTQGFQFGSNSSATNDRMMGRTSNASAQNNRSSFELPAWMQDQYTRTLARVNQINDLGYSPYTGQRVADLDADEQAAIAGIRAAQGLGAEDLDLARANARELAQGVSQDEIRGFYNPFEQDVVAATQADIDYQRQLAEGSARSSAEAAGAFGGDRQAVYQATLGSNVLRDGASTIANLRRSGFNDATNAAMTSRGLRLSGNDQLQRMVAARRGAAYEDAEALAGAGALQRGIRQGRLDAAYDDRNRGLDFEQRRMGSMLDVIRSLPQNVGTTTGVSTGTVDGTVDNTSFGSLVNQMQQQSNQSSSETANTATTGSLSGSRDTFGPEQSLFARGQNGAVGALGTLDDITRLWRDRQRRAPVTAPVTAREIAGSVGAPDLSFVRGRNWLDG